jgi:hypothetical protein
VFSAVVRLFAWFRAAHSCELYITRVEPPPPGEAKNVSSKPQRNQNMRLTLTSNHQKRRVACHDRVQERMIQPSTEGDSAMYESELDHFWVFEIREDADGNEIERRALYSSSNAVAANEWMNTYTRIIGASGPDENGRMWVTNPDDSDVTLSYVIDQVDGSALHNIRKPIDVR